MTFAICQPDLDALARVASAEPLLTTAGGPGHAGALHRLAAELDELEVRHGWTTTLLPRLDIARATLERAAAHTT
jgi:hypothetical protein